MDLAKRDKEIQEIRKLIENRKKLLKDSHKELKKNISISENKNKYLNDIFNDYENDLIEERKQKQKQYDALRIISDYISEIAIEQHEDKDEVKKLRNEQNIILNEMKKIKMQLLDLEK